MYIPSGIPYRHLLSRTLPVSLVLFVILLTVSAIMTIAEANCYVLTSADGETINRDTSPPFDISAPGESPAYRASRARGERLLIKPGVCGAGDRFVANVKAFLPDDHNTEEMRKRQINRPVILSKPKRTPASKTNNGWSKVAAQAEARCSETNNGWSKVAAQAEARCSESHVEFSLKAACVRNEKRGYNEFHSGNYGMPDDVAMQQKALCLLQHQSYSLRAACMRNNARGYRQMTSR